MSSNNWSIIIPKQGVNLIRNPIAGGASGFSAVASATVARSTTYQRFGRWSYKVDYTASGDGIQFNLSASLVSGTKYYFTAWGESANNSQGFLALDNGTDTQALSAIATYGDWTLYGAELANTSTASTINLERSGGFGTGSYYIDGVQLEELAASGDPYTTLIHGDLEGDYRWLGEPHNSGSYRGPLEYSGGIVKPLGAGAAPVTGFGMTVNREAGAGAAPVTVNAQPQALVDGDLTTGVNVLPRFLTIGGRFATDDLADWHATRRALVRALNNRLATVEAQHTPRRLRYTGSGEALEIDVYYESGLEGAASTDATSSNKVTSEEIELRLKAPDPAFGAHGERAVTLDTNDGQTHRLLSGRVLWPDQTRTNWSALGTANNPPSASGTYNSIRALCYTSDGYIWIGGDFQNYDNIANADRLVRYRPDEWLTPFSAASAGTNGTVYAIAEWYDGRIIVGGDFTTIGPGETLDDIAYWDGTNWNDIAAEINTGPVYAIATDAAGDVYVGGDFADWNSASAAYIAKYDDSIGTWVSMGTDPNGIVRAIAVAPDGTVYIGGEFTTAGGATVNRVAYWDGSDWAAMGSGMNGIVYALETDDAGNVYAAGSFTTAGGATANRIAKWNGSGWLPLGSGLGGAAYALKYEAGTLYVGGVFTTAGGYTVTGAAAWSGSDWLPLDIDIPSATVYAIEAVGRDLYLGHNVNGAVTFAGDTGITYAGTAPAYPVIAIERSAGTSARVVSIRNDANGAQLFLNYELLNGEILTIDTRPNRLAVTSNLRGNRYAELSKLSDIGDFSLVPGPDGSLTQAIYAFVDTVGSPTITAYMTYKEAYNGTD